MTDTLDLDALEALGAKYEQSADGCPEIRAYGDFADALVANAADLIAKAREVAALTARAERAERLASDYNNAVAAKHDRISALTAERDARNAERDGARFERDLANAAVTKRDAALAARDEQIAALKAALEKIDHKRASCRSADHDDCVRMFGECLDIARAALDALTAVKKDDSQ